VPLRCTIAILLAGLYFVAKSDIPNASQVNGLANEILLREFASTAKNPSDFLSQTIGHYDLDKESNEVMKRIMSGSDFSEFRRNKDLTSEQYKALGKESKARLMIDFAQTREDIKPEVKAWLQVFYLAPIVSWEEVLAAYRRLEKYRPADLPPKLVVLGVMVPRFGSSGAHAARWEEWRDILREAFPLAKTSEEKSACLMFAAAGAVQINRLPNGEMAARQIWEWARAVESPGLDADMPALLEFNFYKSWVAFAAKDFTAAAELIKRSTSRCMEPLMLFIAGKKEKAFEALNDLRRDTSLSERERSALQALSPLISMAAHKFDEAREAIAELRKKPALTSKESEWIKTMERLVSDWENGVKSRQVPN
jgi:hypothetical protein